MGRRFNGSTGYGSTTASVDLSSYTAATFGFWAYQVVDPTPSSSVCIESSTNYNSNEAWNFNGWANATTITFNYHSNTGGPYSTCTVPKPASGVGMWHHYLATINVPSGTTGNLVWQNVWIDGISQTLTPTYTNGVHAGNLGNNTIYFGARAGTSIFDNVILADFAIWPGILLDATHAWQLGKMHAPAQRVGPIPPRYFWPMNEAGQRAFPVSGQQARNPQIAWSGGQSPYAGPPISVFDETFVRRMTKRLNTYTPAATGTPMPGLIATQYDYPLDVYMGM